jgi:tRNA/rRNA methyltransferase
MAVNAPIIVLVCPQMGENIGAAARAMGNFGLSDLRLVSPRDGWPSLVAQSVASHALPIIEAAKVYDTLAEAIADCEMVYATTARMRELNKPIITARNYPAFTGKTAILFGRENNGLSNEEIALAQGILTIPTHPDCSSINIAQAVLLAAYEWYQQQSQPTLPALAPPALQSDLNGFFDQLEIDLDAINFWKEPKKKEKMWQNLRAIFQRSTPSYQEVQTLRGIIRALGEKRSAD